MRKIPIIILCILMIIMSGCKKKEAEVIVEPTITTSPTQSSPTQVSELTIQDDTFQVQPVIIPQDMETPYMSKEDFPRLDGSTANIPLGEAIYSLLSGASQEEAKENLTFHETAESYRRLMDHEVDLLFVYEPSQAILEEMKEWPMELEFKPIGRDGLVFIVNELNPVNSLTKEQIHNIYTGITTNWSEIGGNDNAILWYQRPESSASQTLMERLVVSKDDIMNGPEKHLLSESTSLKDTILAFDYDRSILGYSTFYYTNYMNLKSGLKIVAIDGVMPNNETIQNGEYPYTNDFYVVIRKEEDKNSNARKIYDWMTSIEAQEIIAQTGYVPVVDVSVSTKTTPKDYGLEINGAMNIEEDQYMILHSTNIEEDNYVGDSLLDRNLNTVITFPGKYINIYRERNPFPEQIGNINNNLLCNNDDILELVSTKVYQGETYTRHELYSLEKQDYITQDFYYDISRTDLGYYICSSHDYDNQSRTVTILDCNGNLIREIDNCEDIRSVQNHIVTLTENTLTFYDENGKELCKKELSFDNVNLGEYNDWMKNDKSYLWVYVNREFLVIFDKDGNEISSEVFLSKHFSQDEIPQLWINNSIVASDGHLYAAGNVNGRLILAREDGVVLLDQENDNEKHNCSLYYNLYGVINLDTNTNQVFTYDGKALNEIGETMPENNDAYFDCKEGKFTVYCKDINLSYIVKDKDYLTYFPWSQGYTIPELTQSQAQQDSMGSIKVKQMRISST